MIIRGFPITNYQAREMKKYLLGLLLMIVAVFLIGNIIAAIFIERIKVNAESYIIKDGFPFFKSEGEYLHLIRSYPYDLGLGTNLNIHRMRRGESYWNVAMRNNISIDTLIAANPFLTSLLAKEGIEIVVPQEEGVLMALDNFYDVWRMSKKLGYKDKIRGEYFPSIFRLFSLDDIRLVFFKAVKPEVVNNHLEGLYKIRKIFQSPIKGYYTSLYGTRIDPFLHGKHFHNGIDIRARTRTPIHPARKGIVTLSKWLDGYGKTVIIQHRDGYATVYGHCHTLKVKKGDWVEQSNIIGLVGSTGRSTGPHLHFTIMRHGRIIDPLRFIW
ncbi:MAG: M23 family metallopeptidase [Spirochaetota bacterium]|nr:M23 family metallopeptidase [Spirochaetota bacterium]